MPNAVDETSAVTATVFAKTFQPDPPYVRHRCTEALPAVRPKSNLGSRNFNLMAEAAFRVHSTAARACPICPRHNHSPATGVFRLPKAESS
jgi:hypothetical protein